MLQVEGQSLKGVDANPTLGILRNFCYDCPSQSAPFLVVLVPGMVIAPFLENLGICEWSVITSLCPAGVAFHEVATADVDVVDLVGGG